MFFIRALHRDKFNPDKGRFDSDIFKNYRGGISVISLDCAIRNSGNINAHLQQYYGQLIGDPAFFFQFDLTFIKETFKDVVGFEVVATQTDSDSGDACHYDLTGISDKQTTKLVKEAFRNPYIYACCGNSHIQLTEEQFRILNEYRCN